MTSASSGCILFFLVEVLNDVDCYLKFHVLWGGYGRLTCVFKSSAVSDSHLHLCGCLEYGGANHEFVGSIQYGRSPKTKQSVTVLLCSFPYIRCLPRFFILFSIKRGDCIKSNSTSIFYPRRQIRLETKNRFIIFCNNKTERTINQP